MSDKGHSGQWVSGPLRTTKQTGIEGGLLGSFTLCLYWEAQGEGERVLWVDFELFEVTAVEDEDGPPEYQRRGAKSSSDLTRNLGDAEVSASGSVKWDGCTQFSMAPAHVESRSSLWRLLAAIGTAREECARAMPGTDVFREYQP